jgi:phosphatidylethanolamine-binding protein (PEBP) family uncharacterized protein
MVVPMGTCCRVPLTSTSTTQIRVQAKAQTPRATAIRSSIPKTRFAPPGPGICWRARCGVERGTYSIHVCGFTWIHWTAAGIDASFAKDGVLAFPEDASNQQAFGMVQGMNSSASRLGGPSRDPLMMCRCNGPQPPDTTHVYTLRAYALDIMPDLKEGFLLNELVRILRARTISWAGPNLPARS